MDRSGNRKTLVIIDQYYFLNIERANEQVLFALSFFVSMFFYFCILN